MTRATQLEGIPTKIVKENLNIFATFLAKDTKIHQKGRISC